MIVEAGHCGGMGAFGIQADFDSGEDSAELVVIGRYRTARLAHESGLTVLAAGFHYWVYPVDEVYVLVVPREIGETMRREVEIGELRNRFWPPPSLDLPSPTTSKGPTIAFIVVLAFLFYGQNANALLEELGMNSSEGVLVDGEWWRLLTAITLHADIGHLAGNVLGISIFAYLCCRYMGSGLAWLAILLVAGLSNLTNVIIHAGEAYRSLGASTAVFGALGLLTGFPLGAYLRTREPIVNRDWLIPFFGGCILFAWMGGGEFPTDVAGHFWSFIYGLAVATVTAWSALHAKISAIQQKGLLATAFLLLAIGWTWALGGL